MMLCWIAVTPLGLCKDVPNLFAEKDRLDRKESLAVIARAGLLDGVLKVETDKKGTFATYQWNDVFAMTRRGIDFDDKRKGLVGVPSAKIDSKILLMLGFKADDLKEYYDDLESAQEVSTARRNAEREREEQKAKALERRRFIEKNRVPATIIISQIVDGGALGEVRTKRITTKMKTVTSLGHKEPRRVWVSGPGGFGFVEGDFSGNVDGEPVSLWVVPAGVYKYTTVLGAAKSVRRYESVAGPKR